LVARKTEDDELEAAAQWRRTTMKRKRTRKKKKKTKTKNRNESTEEGQEKK
jgi:hypothetical protein